MTTKFKEASEHHFKNYLRRQRNSLTEKVKTASGIWKEGAVETLQVHLLALRPVMRDATPSAVTEYADVLALAVQWLYTGQTPRHIEGLRKQVANDLLISQNVFKRMKSLSGMYTQDERRAVERQLVKISYHHSRLH